jgi:hypothetical protein
MTTADDGRSAVLIAELEALLLASHANRDALRDLLTVVTDRLTAARSGTAPG